MVGRSSWVIAAALLVACSDAGALEIVEQPPEFDPPPPECGNGYLEPGEQCDDGNLDEGDGCNASCELPCGLVWETTVPSTHPDVEPFVVDMQLRPNGEIIVAGTLLARSEEFTHDLWLAAFSAEGTPLWSTVLDPQPELDQRAVAVAAADDGSIYLSATIEHGGDEKDPWIGALDSTGTLQWDHSFNGEGKEVTEDEAGGVAVSAAGNPILSAHLRVGEKDSDLWLVEFDAADGSEVWSRFWSGELAENGYSLDRRGPVEVGPDGSIWTLATEYVDWQSVDVRLLQFSPEGTLLDSWAPQAGTGHDHSPGDLSVHPDGRVYFGVRQLGPVLNFWVHELVDGEITWTRERSSFIDVGDVWELGGLAGSDSGELFAGGWLRRQEAGGTWREGWVHRLDGGGQPLCETRYSPMGISIAVPSFNVQALAAPSGGELLLGAGRIQDVEGVESFWVGAFQGP